ncbi:MAG: hypothetical protein K2X66_16485, partial [Cyanobacteria bacterium]|nr:hypothetical protein [Cyanobacteriota bacterium]
KASFFLRWLQFKPYHLRPSPWVEKLQAVLASLLFLAMLYSMADSVLLAQQTGKPNLCLTRSWQYPLWVCEEHLRNLPPHHPVKLK